MEEFKTIQMQGVMVVEGVEVYLDLINDNKALIMITEAGDDSLYAASLGDCFMFNSVALKMSIVGVLDNSITVLVKDVVIH